MIGNPLLLTGGDYEISRSVRLRSSASAYFNRTPGSAGNRQKFGWSGWVKRGALTSRMSFFVGGVTSTGNNVFVLQFDSSDRLDVFGATWGSPVDWQVTSSQVFRDPSAWYHIVLGFDSTNGTSTERVALFVNGTRITSFVTSNYPAQNYTTAVNNVTTHLLGCSSAGSFHLDGYLTEVNFIDGQSPPPSSFGETDAVTGVWKPKKYTGTYGTNGFYLNFSDNSAATAAAIGKDYSGNGNNWTPNNISVTSGATYDSMLDVPTPWADGGNGRGNYAVMNPLDQTNQTVSGANLNTVSTGTAGRIRATVGVTTGKWYFEHTLTAYSAGGAIGVMNINKALGSGDIGANADEWGFLTNSGSKINSGSTTGYGSAITTNDILMCALDLDNSKIWWGKNGTWFASGDPAAGTNAAFTNVTGYTLTPAVGLGNGSSQSWAHNFGQRPFSYTPPSGFKALNTQNLPEPTIKKGASYFDVLTYTANGTLTTRSGLNLASAVDLVWIKSRSNAQNHVLVDSVRGTSVVFADGTSTTNAEGASGGGWIQNLSTTGFSTDANGNINTNGATYVAWNWVKGATQGFDIVTYTGTGAAQNVAHNLGVKPAMAIVKNRSGAFSWGVWHKSLAGETYYLTLNSTAAAGGPDDVFTAFSSTTFSLNTDNWSNANGNNYVCYLWAEVAGFSKFGSYTGNGSTDGPFVFCGFRPRWVMIKKTDTAGDSWFVFDTAREQFNVQGNWLAPNLSNAEATNTFADILSNGFKLRGSISAFNGSGGTYIYAAFAETAFRYSLAR